MIPSAETVKKLNQLKEYITKEPRRFNMSWWGVSAKPKTIELLEEGDDYYYEQLVDVLKKQQPPCGTVACLAGNCTIMAGLTKPTFDRDSAIYEFDDGTPLKAAKWLGLEPEDASKLFYLSDWDYPEHWPESFTNEYYEAEDDFAKRAEIACRRIDHFIKTGE